MRRLIRWVVMGFWFAFCAAPLCLDARDSALGTTRENTFPSVGASSTPRTIALKELPLQEILSQHSTWFHQGYAGEAWVKQAWDSLRTGAGMPPIDGWKQPHPQSQR